MSELQRMQISPPFWVLLLQRNLIAVFVSPSVAKLVSGAGWTRVLVAAQDAATCTLHSCVAVLHEGTHGRIHLHICCITQVEKESGWSFHGKVTGDFYTLQTGSTPMWSALPVCGEVSRWRVTEDAAGNSLIAIQVFLSSPPTSYWCIIGPVVCGPAGVWWVPGPSCGASSCCVHRCYH